MWIKHRSHRNHSVAGQCDFLRRPPVMRLRSVQYANIQWSCRGADEQFPVYQRWRVKITQRWLPPAIFSDLPM